MDFNMLLYTIDSNLNQEDFESLKFLCGDLLQKNKIEKMKSCQDLFEELKKSEDLTKDNYFILQELIYLIGQHSLLKMLDTNKDLMKEQLEVEGKVSMYRRMLFELSEEITNEDLRSIIFLLNIPNKYKENKSFLDILSYLDKKKDISMDNLDVLEKVISPISKELLKKINTYKKNRELLEMVSPSLPTESTNFPVSNPAYPIQDVSSSMDFQDDESESIREHVEEVQELPDEKDVEAENDMSNLSLEDEAKAEVYPMNRKKRGYCVIINNSEFYKTSPRPGTEKDVERLDQVFTWLGFEVVVCNEQNGQQIRNIINIYQKKDHTERDCFVCCILTHGESKAILGIDSESVNINSIVSNFASNCETLAGKPKLFFIQACQGKSTQGTHVIEEDAVSTTRTIPTDADVLIGMSTVDGYYSYRHPDEGTWYIQTLCENLIKMVPKGEDILSILTKVNKDVSEKESIKHGKKLKQMPQPAYTLRMKLVFPVPCSDMK